MKRYGKQVLGAVALAAVLLMSACGAKKDPAAIYDEAIKKQSELTSSDMTMDMNIAMAQGEETIDIGAKMAVKMDGINTDSMHYTNDTKMSAMGQDIYMKMFYADGYLYTEMLGQKIKSPMDLDTLMKQAQSTSASFVQSSAMKEIKAEKDGDNQKLTYTVDPEKMNDYVKEVLGSMSSALGDVQNADIKILEGSGTMTVNQEGYCTEQTMKMKLEMPSGGSAITMDMDLSAVSHNPGQAVTVTVPETDGYIEMDMSALGIQ